jgi:hypothetical protein
VLGEGANCKLDAFEGKYIYQTVERERLGVLTEPAWGYNRMAGWRFLWAVIGFKYMHIIVL